ncbi:hypothetical protein R5R35_004919 [Gryllus longicercus]|uniref:WD repeat-containing protein 55 homolog n=1 Tax=Gryllus longicercus TaxID=2509291 RepID=A0AAN9VE11_9ORTH
MSKITGKVAHPSWLRQREFGQKLPHSVGHSDRFFKALYSTYFPYHSWDQGHIRCANHGGILNIEFSPDGSFIVAACEKHSLLLFDPLSRKMIRSVNNAHTNCVTNVKFVDSQNFATGSDDSTVALWDVRNLKTQIRTFQGHSNSVQDIEFSPQDGLLVTSGFDGSVCTWDINSYEEDLCRKVFYTYDLMRMRLTSDASKMVISTARGYLMIIHDLDVAALAQDLKGFQPDACRMRLRQTGPPAASYALFSRRRRNRVEIVTDFPREDDSSVLSSLELHPAGCAALSRGISDALGLEWTCVHDIQGQGLGGDAGADSDGEDEVEALALAQGQPQAEGVAGPSGAAAAGGLQRATGAQQGGPSTLSGERLEEDMEACGGEEESETESVANASMELCVHSDDSLGDANWLENADACSWDDCGGLDAGQVGAGAEAGAGMPAMEVDASGDGPSSSVHFARFPGHPKSNRVYQYNPRLTHFIEELSAGKWYIKELCFSPDGRLMGSPFGCGVRLFAFSPECSELSVCVPRAEPLPLYELATNICHNSIVLCTRFSPHHCLLVSGCFSGNIIWHQPMI